MKTIPKVKDWIVTSDDRFGRTLKFTVQAPTRRLAILNFRHIHGCWLPIFSVGLKRKA